MHIQRLWLLLLGDATSPKFYFLETWATSNTKEIRRGRRAICGHADDVKII